MAGPDDGHRKGKERQRDAWIPASATRMDAEAVTGRRGGRVKPHPLGLVMAG